MTENEGLSSFTWKGRFGPFDLVVSEHTFLPSTFSVLIADALNVPKGGVVIDAGCGSGILSIVAAKLGASKVMGIDIAPDVVEVASQNAATLGVSHVTQFIHGDLLDPVPEHFGADLIIGDVSGIPDALADVSRWFPTRRGGGPRGSELPIRLLQMVKTRLRAGGRLILPTCTLQDEGNILQQARALFGELTKLVERDIPFPGALADHPAVITLIRDKIVSLKPRGSRFQWTARIWEMTPV